MAENSGATAALPEKVSGSPTKDFFISMITKDIDLEDCILDLLDNSIDGAGNVLKQRLRSEPANGTASTSEPVTSEDSYAEFSVEVELKADAFWISDNCGGISIQDAKNYAFHFGRKKGAPVSAEHSIGLYGIGMKRAMFKMGRKIEVHSSTETEAFRVPINVDEWAGKPDDWDFTLIREGPSSAGTAILIEQLHSRVSEDFEDITFVNHLIHSIARDYSFFLQAGLRVVVNGTTVLPYAYALLESPDFEPFRIAYRDDEGVDVEIVAGLSKLPPDDDSADSESPPEVDYYGWFVACNDRIVVAGDKTKRTVWGDETDDFPGWHPQYNGFMGIVRFRATEPNLLPWTTTKRDVDTTLPVYRRAVVKMKEATRVFIRYTNARKAALADARVLEERAVARPLSSIPLRQAMKVPQFPKTERVELGTIRYMVPKAELREVAVALGDRLMSHQEVGRKTFYYYREREVEVTK